MLKSSREWPTETVNSRIERNHPRKQARIQLATNKLPKINKIDLEKRKKCIEEKMVKIDNKQTFMLTSWKQTLEKVAYRTNTDRKEIQTVSVFLVERIATKREKQQIKIPREQVCSHCLIS